MKDEKVTNLVNTWLEAGKSAGLEMNREIIDQMNEHLGTNIPECKIYAWRNGSYGTKIPNPVIDYMMMMSIQYALSKIKPKVKLKSSQSVVVLSMLKMPKRKPKSN